MRMDRSRVKRPSDVARSQDEARLALRRVVQATRTHLAEMERLLAKADRLVSQPGCARTDCETPRQSAHLTT